MLCTKCSEKLFKKECAECGKAIKDDTFVEALGRFYHSVV